MRFFQTINPQAFQEKFKSHIELFIYISERRTIKYSWLIDEKYIF